MRIVIDNQRPTAAWVAGIDVASGNLSEAAKQAGTEVADETTQQGRADIASAGRFGPAWQRAFRATSKPIRDGVEVVTTMHGQHWRMFEEGRVIQGKPLLWIPFSDTDARGVPHGKYPGGLVQTTSRRGLPLLISTRDHRPKYFGKESVTIPKKFHLAEIAKAVGATIGDKFAAAYRGLMRNG